MNVLCALARVTGRKCNNEGERQLCRRSHCVAGRQTTSSAQPMSLVLADQTLFHRAAECPITASEVTHWGWQPNIYL